MPERIIIIGNGIAGVTAIKAIREVSLEYQIYLIGEEDFYPYNRIRLSKGLFGEINENNLLLQKKEWYEENKVKVFIDTKVLSINTQDQEIVLSDGLKLKYDKLLLANGARNAIPPIEGIVRRGVYSLRSLKDALDIKERLKEKEEIIIIGGGIQGLEMAWVLNQYGKKVKIIELQPRLMYNQIDVEAGKILKTIVEGYDIEVLTDTTVKEIKEGDELGVILADKGQLNGDIIIYSAGIKPNIEQVRNTEVKTARGVLVNNKMQTNIENIYAAGDIAEFDNHVAGLWNIAILQGKIAGYNISGKNTVYDNIVPVTTLNAFGTSLFSMGSTVEEESTKLLVEEHINLKQYNKIFISYNRIVGAIVIGDTKKSPLLKSAIEKGISLENMDISKLSVNELLDKLKDYKK